MTDATERSCIRIKDVVTGFAIRKSLVTLASAAEWSRGDRSQTAVGERKKVRTWRQRRPTIFSRSSTVKGRSWVYYRFKTGNLTF